MSIGNKWLAMALIFISGFALPALAKKVWFKPGATVEDFEQAWAEAELYAIANTPNSQEVDSTGEAVAQGASNAVRIATLQNRYLEANGWRRVREKDIPELLLEHNQARGKALDKSLQQIKVKGRLINLVFNDTLPPRDPIDEQEVKVLYEFPADFAWFWMAVNVGSSNPFRTPEEYFATMRSRAADMGADLMVILSSKQDMLKAGLQVPETQFACFFGVYAKASLGIFMDIGGDSLNDRIIRKFRSGSLAQDDGLRIGDNILEFNGRDVVDVIAYQDEILSWSSGDRVDVTLVRNGMQMTIPVRTVPNKFPGTF